MLRYRWWLFVPYSRLLILLVILRAEALSSLIRLFVILGTLGDYVLVSWKHRRHFLWLFVLLPYSVIVFFTTKLGAPYLEWLWPNFVPEPYWLEPAALMPLTMASVVWGV